MKKILSIIMAVSLVFGVTGAVSAAPKTTKPAKQQVKTVYVTYPGNGSALKIKKGYKKETVLKEMKPMAVEVFNIFGGYYAATNEKGKDKNAKVFNSFVDKAIPKTFNLDIMSTKEGYILRPYGSIFDADSKDLVKLGKNLQKITKDTKLGTEFNAWEEDDTLTINFLYDTKVGSEKYQSRVQFQFKSLNDKYYVLTGIYTT